MTTTSPEARPATATPLTFAANPGGRFPSVLTEDDGRVTAPAGGESMWVIHRYEDLLSVKSSPAWRMANRCETPLTGAEIPGGDPPGHLLGMDGAPHRKLRRTIGHLFTSDAAGGMRPRMRKTAAGLLDQIAVAGTGDLRADYAEPATAATVCAALQIPAADWAPIIRPAGEAAFGVVHPGGGVAASRAAWDGIWEYYRRVVAAKRASPDDGLVAQMYLAMNRAGYTTEEIVRAVATVSNGATALLPVLERVLLWLLQHPDTVAGVFLGELTWPRVIREAMLQGALFPVTPPLVAGHDARIGEHPVPAGTVVLPSLVSAVHHPRGGAWLAFGPGQHRCPGDELTLAAVEEYAGAFFRRFPCACLTTPVLAWRDGPLATPREARFAVRRLRRTGSAAALPGAHPLRPWPRCYADFPGDGSQPAAAGRRTAARAALPPGRHTAARPPHRRQGRTAARAALPPGPHCRQGHTAARPPSLPPAGRHIAVAGRHIAPAVMFGVCGCRAMIWCGISAGITGHRAGCRRLSPRVAAGLRLPVAAVRQHDGGRGPDR